MQSQADALLTALRDFVAQPDYPTLVLNASDASLVYALRALAAFDRQDEGAYYLLFPQPYVDAGAYMAVIAEGLGQQLELLNVELSARQRPPLPEFPAMVLDGRYPPAERMRAAIEHLGQWLPGEAPIVWGLAPGELSRMADYRALVLPLLAMEGVAPWMNRHRFILRDQPPDSPLTKGLLAAQNDRVLVMDLDFGGERFVQSLLDTVHDKDSPADARMSAFFQLAAVDFAFKRYREALEKYGACFNYFEGQGNKPMQALCLSGAGDAELQAGRVAPALAFYQQALAVGVEDRSLPVIQVSAFGAGNACLALARYEDAEGYFQHADDAAAKLHNPFVKCDAMEKRGLAAWHRGEVERATDVWTKGVALAKEFSYPSRALSIVESWLALSRKVGDTGRVSMLQAERAALAKSVEATASGTGGGPHA